MEEKSVTEQLISIFKDENKDTQLLKDFVILKNLLSKEECERSIDVIEKMGMKPLNRPNLKYPLNKTRKMTLYSPELAESIWKRLEKYIPFKEIRDECGDIWHISGIGDKFRFFSYGNKEGFKAHMDGYSQPSFRQKSFASLIIYLNDVDDEKGGSTRFIDYGMYIRPRAGNAIAYLSENLLHDGEVVKNEEGNIYLAEKYIIRAEIMFECKKYKNSEMKKKIYDLKIQANQYQEEGKDELVIELWENIVNLEKELKNLSISSQSIVS